MPPWVPGPGLVCFLTRLTPSTRTLFSAGMAWMTLPCLPLSLPVMTWTRSPFLIFMLFAMRLEHLRRQRDDLHELLVTQLAAHGAEDAGTTGVALGVLEDDGGVLVEPDVGTVRTTALLHGADDDGLDHVTLLHRATGDRVLDGGDDDVPDTGVAATGATENADAENLLGTRVVGDTQSRLLLDHSFLLIVN